MACCWSGRFCDSHGSRVGRFAGQPAGVAPSSGDGNSAPSQALRQQAALYTFFLAPQVARPEKTSRQPVVPHSEPVVPRAEPVEPLSRAAEREAAPAAQPPASSNGSQTARAGEVLRDDQGNPIGRLDLDGQAYDRYDRQLGFIDGAGQVFLGNGAYQGRLDQDGHLYDREGRHLVVLYGTPPPAWRVEAVRYLLWPYLTQAAPP